MRRPPSSDEVQHRFVALPRDDGAIVRRLDGWVIASGDDMSMPYGVAEQIMRNLPILSEATRSDHYDVESVRKRMRIRQRMCERNGRLSGEV
jgi:hypothetical protein